MKSIEKQIAALGWTLEFKQVNADVSQFSDWRACQGGFCTPWRYSPDDVLKDVQDLKRTEVAAALIETNPKAALAEFRDE